MKKLLSILLVLSLVYGLCGCAGGETAGQTEPNESAVLSDETVSDTVDTAEGENKEISYDFTVSVTMPAAFTVYLDNEMHIAAMEAEDADSEAILSGLELAGMTYDEGMGLVLNAAYAQDILTDQGKVKFTVAAETISMSFMEALFAPVMEFEKDNGMYVFIDWDVIPEEEPDFEANYLYNLQKIEGEDQTIYMDKSEWIHPTAGGQTVYSYYSEFPNPMVYEYTPIMIGGTLDTIRIKMLYFNEDGSSSVTYFEDGLCVKTVGINEGELQAYEYENGEIAGDIIKNEDGSYSFTEWAGIKEDGYILFAKAFGCWEDGTQFTSTYYSNGNVATSETIGSDGSFSQRTFDENGNEIHAISKFLDGTQVEWKYENNQLIYSKEVSPDGSQTEWKYENDQLIYCKDVNPDGSWTECKYENNMLIYDKTVNPDGTYQESHLENGNWTFTEGVIEPTEPES